MTVATATLAGKFFVHALKGDIDTDTDTWKASLHLPAAVLAKDTTEFFNTVGSELATAGGYTAGGATVAVSAPVYTAANAWGISRAATTTYAAGDVVRPAIGNGFIYQATVAGTTGAGLPAYPTAVGATVADGTVTWQCIGTGAVSCDIADAVWAGATWAIPNAPRYCVIRKDTGTPSTSPVIGWLDAGAAQEPAGVPFSVLINASGLLLLPV